MKKVILIVSVLLSAIFSTQVLASQWKLSYEMGISDTRKVCVYEKDGLTKQVEQAKSQYCRTYL